MKRVCVLLVMLFAMFWQSVAVARVGLTVTALADREHAMLHWQEEGHHHHEDGSYHQDNSSESVQHMVADHLNASLALVAQSSYTFSLPGSAAPGGLHETAAPNPTLDGLLRPPRSRT